MGAVAGAKTITTLVIATLLASTMTSCSRDAPEPAGLSTATRGSTIDGADGSPPGSTGSKVSTGTASRLPPASILDDPCADLIAGARITTRDPTSFWTVTGLEGEISNPSSGAVRVTAVYLQFEPGTPPDVHTAELTVPLDLTLAAGSSAPWIWTGSILVRPFHDDAPQPVVHDLDWTREGPGTAPSCEDQGG